MSAYGLHNGSGREVARRGKARTWHGALAVFMTSVLLISLLTGCGTPAQTTTPAPVTTCDPLELRIEKIDPKKGIQILLVPKNTNCVLNVIEGTVNVKLWWYGLNEVSIQDYSLLTTDNRLVQEWSLPLTKENYSFLGAILFLPYNEYASSIGSSQDRYGFMRVSLEIPGGTALSVERKGLDLAAYFSC